MPSFATVFEDKVWREGACDFRCTDCTQVCGGQQPLHGDPQGLHWQDCALSEEFISSRGGGDKKLIRRNRPTYNLQHVEQHDPLMILLPLSNRNSPSILIHFGEQTCPWVALVELHLQRPGEEWRQHRCRIPEDCSWQCHPVHVRGSCEAISPSVKPCFEERFQTSFGWLCLCAWLRLLETGIVVVT